MSEAVTAPTASPPAGAFRWTAKQLELGALMAGPATHILARGGGRSGKTARIVRQIVMRALKAGESRHLITRYRFNHLRASIINGTFPWVMERCFPEVRYRLDKMDWFVQFENRSQVWFCGLDEKERTEKVLGMEFCTIFPNECSQIPYSSILIVRTRLAQKVMQFDGMQLPLKMFYDCNPPPKSHWTYRLFIKHVDPETNQPLPDRHRYATLQMNPIDNVENLPAETIEEYKNLPGRLRKRFWEGEFGEVVENALFPAEVIDRWRVMDGELPEMRRIVIGVDPSGSTGQNQTPTEAERHATGIVVVGLGNDGIAYVMEDLTMTAPPAVWGNAIAAAYDRLEADRVVGEVNFGGAMVEQVIRAAKPTIAFRQVRASRGKHIRAEPVSSLMEQGKVRIVGHMRKLEDELEAFSTLGYMGDGSPNHGDAMIHATAELFPAITAEKRRTPKDSGLRLVVGGACGWMA